MLKRREVRWERMFPDELEAAFEACPVAYLPYGLCVNPMVRRTLLEWMPCVKRLKPLGVSSLPRNTGIATKSACTPPGQTGRLEKPDLGLQLSRHGSI